MVRLELRGAGGEPVGFARTLLSHGVAELPPNVVAQDGSSLETVLAVDGSAQVVRVVADGTAATVDVAAAVPVIRHMLRLDEDLSAFYARAAQDAELAWVATGAGRMLRSPTVFEDLVKTICTTNCTWSATVRMVSALVGELGVPAADAPARRTFPTPEALAAADASFYTDVAKTGYRGPYLRSIAADVASGSLDLEAFNDPALSDAEVAERLLALPGVGPYACAHMMMLIGRYGQLILDSWTRPTYRRLTGRPRVRTSASRRPSGATESSPGSRSGSRSLETGCRNELVDARGEAGQQRRRECRLRAELPRFVPAVDEDAAARGIDEPDFLDAGLKVELTLASDVIAPSTVRAHFDDQLRNLRRAPLAHR
jgi:N-glycosylase/DNA lyase